MFEPDLPVYDFTKRAYLAAHLLLEEGDRWDSIEPYVRLPFPSIILEHPTGDWDPCFKQHPAPSRLSDMVVRYHLVQNEETGAITGLLEGHNNVLSAFRIEFEDGEIVTSSVERPAYLDPSEFFLMPVDMAVLVCHRIARLLAYLHIPKMSESELLPANTKINERRFSEGKDPLPNITRIRPHASKMDVLDWFLEREKNGGLTPPDSKWWGAYYNCYWCGPKNPPGQQWPEWLLVKGRLPINKKPRVKVGEKPTLTKEGRERRTKQLEERRQAKETANVKK